MGSTDDCLEQVASISRVLRFTSADLRSSRLLRFTQTTISAWRHLVVCEQLRRHAENFQSRQEHLSHAKLRLFDSTRRVVDRLDVAFQCSNARYVLSGWHAEALRTRREKEEIFFRRRAALPLPAYALAKSVFRVWAALVVSFQRSTSTAGVAYSMGTQRPRRVAQLLERATLALISHVWSSWRFSAQVAQECRRIESRHVIIECIRGKTRRLAQDIMTIWQVWMVMNRFMQQHGAISFRLQHLACVAKLNIVRMQRVDLLVAILFDWCHEVYKTRKQRLLEDRQLLQGRSLPRDACGKAGSTSTQAIHRTVYWLAHVACGQFLGHARNVAKIALLAWKFYMRSALIEWELRKERVVGKQAFKQHCLAQVRTIVLVWRQEVKAQKFHDKAKAKEEKLAERLSGILDSGGSSPLVSTFQLWTEATLRYQNAQRASHIEELQYQAQQLHQKVESIQHSRLLGARQQERSHRCLVQALALLNSTHMHSTLQLTITTWWQYTCVAIHQSLKDSFRRSTTIAGEKILRALGRMVGVQYCFSASQVLNAWQTTVRQHRHASCHRQAELCKQRWTTSVCEGQDAVLHLAVFWTWAWHAAHSQRLASQEEIQRLSCKAHANAVLLSTYQSSLRSCLSVASVLSAWRAAVSRGHVAEWIKEAAARQEKAAVAYTICEKRQSVMEESGTCWLMQCIVSSWRQQTQICILQCAKEILHLKLVVSLTLASWKQFAGSVAREKLLTSLHARKDKAYLNSMLVCIHFVKNYHTSLLNIAVDSWQAVVEDARLHEEGRQWQGRARCKIDGLVTKFLLPREDVEMSRVTFLSWKWETARQQCEHSAWLWKDRAEEMYDQGRQRSMRFASTLLENQDRQFCVDLSRVIIAMWRADTVGVKRATQESNLEQLHDRVQHLHGMVREKSLRTVGQWILCQGRLLVQILFTSWRAWVAEMLGSGDKVGVPREISSNHFLAWQKVAAAAYAVERYAPLSVVATAGLVVDGKREVQNLKDLFLDLCHIGREAASFIIENMARKIDFGVLLSIMCLWQGFVQHHISRTHLWWARARIQLQLRSYRRLYAKKQTTQARHLKNMRESIMLHVVTTSWKHAVLSKKLCSAFLLHLRCYSGAVRTVTGMAHAHDDTLVKLAMGVWRLHAEHEKRMHASSRRTLQVASRWAFHRWFSLWYLAVRSICEASRWRLRDECRYQKISHYCKAKSHAGDLYHAYVEWRRVVASSMVRLDSAWRWQSVQAERRKTFAHRESMFFAWMCQVRHARWLKSAVFYISQIEKGQLIYALVRCVVLAWRSVLSDTRSAHWKDESDRSSIILQKLSLLEATKFQESWMGFLIQSVFHHWARHHTGSEKWKLQAEVDQMTRELTVARLSCERRRDHVLAIMEGSMNSMSAALRVGAVKASLPEIPTPVEAG